MSNIHIDNFYEEECNRAVKDLFKVKLIQFSSCSDRIVTKDLTSVCALLINQKFSYIHFDKDYILFRRDIRRNSEAISESYRIEFSMVGKTNTVKTSTPLIEDTLTLTELDITVNKNSVHLKLTTEVDIYSVDYLFEEFFEEDKMKLF